MDAFGDLLCNGYGSTETGFGTFATPQDLRAAPGTIGRPQLATTVQILDEARRPVATGRTGHIFIGGDLVFDGYAGGGSKERSGTLMNTGDLGHADTAGRLFVDGREDDMIVSGGENVFPQEVEDALATHPAVADVAVIGVDDVEFGQRLRAFVVAAVPAEPPTAESLAAHVRERLERYKVPRDFVFCAAIPRNATGKTLRRVLAESGA
jgi:fatty-acyl-CoA synthase